MERDGATAPDRGGLWPVPYTRHERQIIRVQAKNDRRNIPQIWLWPVLPPEQEGGSDLNDAFWESARTVGGARRYGSPIAVHVYVDWSPERKGRRKGATQTKGTVRLGLSRAETRRLGLLLDTRNVQENLWSDGDESVERDGSEVPIRGDLEKVFVPPPGSVFRWANRYYQINQWEPKYLGPTDIVTVYKGTGQQVAEDSTTPGMPQLEPPPSFRPQRPRGTPEGVRGTSG